MHKAVRALGGPRQWRRDALLRRLFANSGVLLGGGLLATALGLLSLALTARALGVEAFGVLVLITTYVTVVDRLVNFQTWQALIKYGADALQQGRHTELAALFRFGLLLDGATALLGAALAMAGAWWLGQWQGWEAGVVWLAVLYGLTILAHISGTPTAILRLFGRFRLLAGHTAVDAAIKLVAVAAAYLAGAGLAGFLLAWALADVLGRLLLLALGWRELRRRRLQRVAAGAVRALPGRRPGLWRFVWTSNLNTALRSAIREVDTLIVGAVLGAAAAGLYRIVKSAAQVLGRLIDPLYAVAYPEISRLVAAGDRRGLRGYALRAGFLSGALGLALVAAAALVAPPLIEHVLGADYLPAYLPMLVYLLGQVVWSYSYPLSATVLAFGLPQVSLWVLLASLFVYFPALYLLLEPVGLLGASLASVLFYLFWAACMGTVVVRQYRRWPAGKEA